MRNQGWIGGAWYGGLGAQKESAVRAFLGPGGKGGKARRTGHLLGLKIQDDVGGFLFVLAELGAPVGFQRCGGLRYHVTRDRE